MRRLPEQRFERVGGAIVEEPALRPICLSSNASLVNDVTSAARNVSERSGDQAKHSLSPGVRRSSPVEPQRPGWELFSVGAATGVMVEVATSMLEPGGEDKP